MRCQRCGNEIHSSELFCGQCGLPVRFGTEPGSRPAYTANALNVSKPDQYIDARQSVPQNPSMTSAYRANVPFSGLSSSTLSHTTPLQPAAGFNQPVQPVENGYLQHNPNNPTGSMQRLSNPTGSMQRLSNPTGSMQRLSNPTGSMQRIGNPTGSMQRLGNPTGSMQGARNPTEAFPVQARPMSVYAAQAAQRSAHQNGMPTSDPTSRQSSNIYTNGMAQRSTGSALSQSNEQATPLPLSAQTRVSHSIEPGKKSFLSTFGPTLLIIGICLLLIIIGIIGSSILYAAK